MILLTPTSVINVTRSTNNPKPVNQAKRKRTLEVLGYRVNASKVKRRIWLLFLMPSVTNLYFLTITFPQGTTDDCCKWLLNTVLTNLKKQGYFKNYLWVSERQQNGTIHYHFFITQYTPASNIQSAISASLTTAYKKGLSTYPPAKCSNYQGFFFSKNKHGRVQNLKTLNKNKRKLVAGYCAKYVAKDLELTDCMPICSRRSGTSDSIARLELSREECGLGVKQCYHFVIAPALRMEKHFIENGYTISLFTEIPPPEFTVFWEYIQDNDSRYKGICINTGKKI